MKQEIQIKNIYYMLAYAFSTLKQTNYQKIETENFENVNELLSEILFIALSQQIKQGLYKEYVLKEESFSTVKGKINVQHTIQNKMIKKHEIVCEYDELTENNIYNQIIHTTICLLIRKNISLQYKEKLKKIRIYFSDIDEIDYRNIQWNQIHYDKNNQSYQMILNICFFVIQHQLLTQTKGHKKAFSFTEDQLCTLYEHFVLNYYRKHYPFLNPKSKEISWNLEEDCGFMPKMRSDIYLSNKEKILIIDAKFYKQSMQEYYSKKTFHSHNLYQIMAYVTHEDKEKNFNVKGMLLYAKSDIDFEYKIKDNGYEYEFKTLDLNLNFESIKKQLNSIVKEYFNLYNSKF